MDRFAFRIFNDSVKKRLIEAQDRIIVSVSGGVDSMSLLCLLQAFREKIDITLHLVHFHHGLRKESDDEANFISAMAKERAVPVSIYRTNRLKGVAGMQNRAREWRYRHLRKTMEALGFHKIALGHHRGDLIETQIWRMLRGGSLFSLNPIQASAPPYIRPLLATPKEELRAYMRRIGQPWKEDGTNRSDDYTRNIIRNRLFPILETCAGERWEEKLLALADDALQLRDFFRETVPPATYRKREIDFRTISNLNPVFAKECIHQYLLHNGQREITRDNIDTIHRLASSGRGGWKVCLKGGATAVGQSKKICLTKFVSR